ncbi:MAG: hypothetical protein FJZ01_25055 [Candidatus Sericytochromatia bacterium]|nr:hypothetical protein [Candidatus Tanganyikabacteria bacterium]
MGIGPVGRKESAGNVTRTGTAQAAAAHLSLGSDSFVSKRRDGAPEAQAAANPGTDKIAIGGALAGASIVGVAVTAGAASMPFWVPLLFGAGVVVGGAILLKGAVEWAGNLTNKLGDGLPGNLPK